ncbi:hypothetical protein [Paludisphaera rhizosphaerae]|uniref:hypothetical protein n=1 Tax=Paludisphaera rhizosphaerae TaxID=2711216 RepID=UPI0013E9C92E|nr:hypothetical protein [Paludisphaera rhizosphaerae]
MFLILQRFALRRQTSREPERDGKTRKELQVLAHRGGESDGLQQEYDRNLREQRRPEQ